MTTKTVDIAEAQRQLAAFVAQVATGTEIIITEDAIPRARLIPVEAHMTHRVAGLHTGAITTSVDFDAPLPDEFWTGAV